MTLRKAKKRVITQAEAPADLGVSVRHVKRLLKALKKRGDKAVMRRRTRCGELVQWDTSDHD